MLAGALVKALDHVAPERRRTWAARLFVATIVGWWASAVLLVVLGQSTFFNQMLMAISWLAISITAIDVLSTTDVRAQGE